MNPNPNNLCQVDLNFAQRAQQQLKNALTSEFLLGAMATEFPAPTETSAPSSKALFGSNAGGKTQPGLGHLELLARSPNLVLQRVPAFAMPMVRSIRNWKVILGQFGTAPKGFPTAEDFALVPPESVRSSLIQSPYFKNWTQEFLKKLSLKSESWVFLYPKAPNSSPEPFWISQLQVQQNTQRASKDNFETIHAVCSTDEAQFVVPGIADVCLSLGSNAFFEAWSPFLERSGLLHWTNSNPLGQLDFLAMLAKDPVLNLLFLVYNNETLPKRFEVVWKRLCLESALRNNRNTEANRALAFFHYGSHASPHFRNLAMTLALDREDPKIKRLADTFAIVWDRVSCQDHGGVPSTNALMKLLQPPLKKKQAPKNQADKSSEPARPSQKSKSPSWRLTRSQMSDSTPSDRALFLLSDRLRIESAHQRKMRGLVGLAPINIHFEISEGLQAESADHGNHGVQFDIQTNCLILGSAVATYPFHQLIEIIKWALAWQLQDQYEQQVDQDSKILEGKEFGDSFQKSWQLACKRMGLEAQFREPVCSHSQVPSSWEVQSDNLTDDEKKFLDRVDKLFNLAQSSNENEAALAAQKAQDLLNSRNISRHTGRVEKGDMVRLVLDIPTSKESRVVQYISRILSSHFFVKVIWTHGWNSEKGESQPTLTLLGRKENVLLAEHVLDFLSDQAERLWLRKKAELKLVPGQKLSYKLGLIQGFQEKLDLQAEQRKKGTGSGNLSLDSSADISALISLEKKDLEDFTKELFPSLGNKTTSVINIDSGALATGKKDGKDLVIHAPIESKISPKEGKTRLMLS